MKIIYEGHSCFQLQTASGLNILLDPYISGNPACGKSPADFLPDLILVSHGHGDHLGDALEIARASGASLAAATDLLGALDTAGLKTIGFHIGGSFEFKEAKITMTQAIHGSTVHGVYAGPAVGFLIRLEGLTIYFAGDTALFGDMQAVLGRYAPDYALLPIGGFYTMDAADALIAAQWLQAKTVIPMHYNTFPVIETDVAAFKRELEEKSASRCLILEPGQSYEA